MSKKHNIILLPLEHIYLDTVTNIKYTSVTKVIGSIEPEFDEEAIATAIVKQSDSVKQPRYIGMNKHQILEYWQYLNDIANEYGTKVHDIIERYLKAKKWYVPKDEFEEKVINGFEELKIDEGIRMQPERIMFSEEHKLAGMSDLVIDINDEFFDIGDHKTNEKFNFFNEFEYQTLLPPFDYWQNCQYSIYTIQLSTYARMYEMETGKKCRQIWISYWDKKKEVFNKIPIMYVKHEAMKLLELHKYNSMAV